VYALDEHRVLRRYRRRDVPENEVNVMRHVHAHGYPTPAVLEASGPDLILERLYGPTMQEVLESSPGELDRQIRVLAALHDRLHTIEAPPGLAAIGAGRTLLHLDLHPRNVILGSHGPSVIDWANARSGHWADDVAQTIVVIWGALADPAFVGREAIVHHFVETFVASFDRGVVRSHLRAAIARRVADGNVTDAEREVTRRAAV
jgi:tRNA A-37 threonylcarbamoyl transferase component Bud32